MTREDYMNLALKLAREAADAGEVPVGCVVAGPDGAVISNAIAASTRDPRFSAITEDELEALEINVDVLGEPEAIDSPDMLDVKRYGVIVEKGYRRGLLLPDLEGVDTVEYQIAIAMQKAGIGFDEKGIKLYRFEVVRHE